MICNSRYMIFTYNKHFYTIEKDLVLTVVETIRMKEKGENFMQEREKRE